MGSYDNQASGYLDPGEVNSSNVKQMCDHFYQYAYPANASYWQQGSIDKRFKVGDQTMWSMVYGDNNYFQSRRFFFNLIMRHINMVEGYQRAHRKSTITLPIFQNDSLSDDYNQALKWCENRDGFQEYFSQAFGGALDTGLTLLHLYPDYTLDPISGDLFTDQVAYNNFLIDPYWRKMDFTDCQFIWRRRWVTRNAAKALLPGRDKEIDKMQPSSMKDGRFPLQAELINLDTHRLFTYDEIHYRSTREAKVIVDPISGEAIEWEESKDGVEDELDQVLRHQPWLKVKKMQIPTVKLCIQLGGRVVYDGDNLLHIDNYPFVPMVCYHEPDIQTYQWRIMGMVRNMRDSQYLYNLRKVIELDILQSQINSGWIYPVDVVTDPKAFRQSGQGFLIPLKTGHTPQEIQRIDPPSIPQSMIELSRNLSEDMTKISGVNEELLGAATDDKAGILSMLRQSAGLITLQKIFDKADYSQRLYGKIRLEAVRKNFSKGKITSILGHEPDPKFFSNYAQKYTIAVEEGNYSATQRQTELQQLLYFKELGIPISNESILKAAVITNKQEIIQDMQKAAEQQNQMQAAQAQVQQQKDNADIIGKFAKARTEFAREKDIMASAHEKTAKIDDLQADAEMKRHRADLDTVKMMIELEDLDLANLRANLELAEYIKQQNAVANQPMQTIGV